MPLSDADMRAIQELIRKELSRGAEGAVQAGQGDMELGTEASAAVAPLPGIAGNWELESAGTGGTEAGALSAPVEFDNLESLVRAGGRLLVTHFRGRFRQDTEAGGIQKQQGERFNGTSVIAYDAPNDQYIELYADDQGKVNLSTAERYESDGQTLRLYHNDYVTEYAADGPQHFTVNIYEAGSGTEAMGSRIKSATLRRQ